MAIRRSFKSDISFLEKISIGAVGTKRLFENLRDQGHRPIELERGSMSFKVWTKIKIKRIRVPDILCVDCSSRVESRAKTSFEISMSHSLSDPERGWDFGLYDTDLIALAVCRRIGDKPIDWQAEPLVQYATVHDLRSAEADDRALSVRPKGPEEGFEIRIVWPSTVATSAGTVVSVTDDVIQYRRQGDGRLITLRLSKQGRTLDPLVRSGETVDQHQVLAAVVPITKTFACSHSAMYSDYLSQLSSPSLSARYAATKALSHFLSPEVLPSLRQSVNEATEHVYVRLEAAASLARHDDQAGWSFIEQCLQDHYLQNRLEAVIVLSEIPGDRSCGLLTTILADERQDPEIRAGAAWGLGELQNRLALNHLIAAFSGVGEPIRAEAARALAKLASNLTPEILREFPEASEVERPGLAWALSKAGKFGVDDLAKLLVDNDARHWVAYMLGTQDQRKYLHEIERIRGEDPEVYFAVTVLWKILTSWVSSLEEYG